MPAFDTPITLSGPLRRPVQLIGDQTYGGHGSIHDDDVAAGLGFASGAIEGPVHFSQFVPVLMTLWGDEWLTSGTISVHYSAPCVAGEQVRAFAEAPADGARTARIWMEKEDGTVVLSGSAAVGELTEQSEPTEARRRLEGARPPVSLRILDQLHVGQRAPTTDVRIDPGVHLGDLYPFTIDQKLAAITERLAWYDLEPGAGSPWEAPVLPIEMVSVLFQYTDNGFALRQPSVGLFMDQEITMRRGPVFVGVDYRLDRTVVALSESRRTESFWIEHVLTDPADGEVVATGLLQVGMFKDSYPG